MRMMMIGDANRRGGVPADLGSRNLSMSMFRMEASTPRPDLCVFLPSTACRPANLRSDPSIRSFDQILRSDPSIRSFCSSSASNRGTNEIGQERDPCLRDEGFDEGVCLF